MISPTLKYQPDWFFLVKDAFWIAEASIAVYTKIIYIILRREWMNLYIS